MKRFVVLVGAVVSAASACAPHVDEQAATVPRGSGKPVAVRQTRDAGLNLDASISDDVIDVSVARREDCRWVATIPVERGERSEPMEPRRRESPWKPCSTVPLVGVAIVLHVGGRTTSGKTDERGLVRFDLGQVEEPQLDPKEATVALSESKLKAPPVTLNLRGTRYRERWQVASVRSSQAAWERARQADQSEQDSLLDEAEAQLDALEAKPEPWGDPELTRVRKVSRVLQDIAGRHPEGSPPRAQRVSERLQALDAKTKRLIAAMQKRKEEEAPSQAKRAKAAARAVQLWAMPPERRASCFDPCYAQCVGSGQFREDLEGRCRERCLDACL